MPTQTSTTTVPEYAMFDTAPPLPVQLCDGAGVPINLTGATVVINITPTAASIGDQDPTRLVSGGACVIDPDQGTYTGWVTWSPLTDDLSRWGSYVYNFEVTYADDTRQTIAPNVANSLIIRYPAGGTKYAVETQPGGG
jgi:hypothetical protein